MEYRISKYEPTNKVEKNEYNNEEWTKPDGIKVKYTYDNLGINYSALLEALKHIILNGRNHEI